MNPLIKKEIRLLFPAWVAAMVLAVVPFVSAMGAWGFDLAQRDVVSASFVGTFVWIFFALGVLLLGISSFGQELNSGCFGALLSQPTERRRIWSVKVITLAALVTFSGGLWTTLLFRQTAGAFWFTLLSPLAIIMGLSIVLPDWDNEDQETSLCIVAALILYSIAGFFLAWRLFMRAQDLAWAGGEISLPWRGKFSGLRIISAARGPRHWLSALVWKEIQLHQASLIIAAVLLVLHLACIVTHRIHRHFGPDPDFILETFWTLWLLMPLLIGATAIAEERRIGILDTQLCAPVSRRAQFVIKFSVALVLSLTLGAVTPLVVQGIHTPNDMMFLVEFALGIFLIAFYASSLARTTLQAMGLTVVVAAVIFFYEILPWFSYFGNQLNGIYGLELLKHYLSLPILLFVLIGMASWNFKWLHQNRKLGQRNVIAILAACASITILANAIYFRPWELLQPLETRGLVRITSPAQVKIVGNFQAIYALLPDGRLWSKTAADNHKNALIVLMPNHERQGFIGGSNWVDVAAGQIQTMGIQSDGSLWSIQNRRMTQVGSDKDWYQVASDSRGFLLLKRDGTLWAWLSPGYSGLAGANKNLNRVSSTSRSPVSTNSAAKRPGRPRHQSPVRISDDANWTSLYSTRLVAYARKNDGVYWVWRSMRGTNQASGFVQETNVDNPWKALAFGWGDDYVEVTTNGELWYCDHAVMPHSRKIQLGLNMKWQAATFGPFGMTQSITAIASDGTLWLFPIGFDPRWGRFNPDLPQQLGHHSDWVASVNGLPIFGGIALASDGSIWDWSPRNSYAWLAPSRRPSCLGNIFESEGGKE